MCRVRGRPPEQGVLGAGGQHRARADPQAAVRGRGRRLVGGSVGDAGAGPAAGGHRPHHGAAPGLRLRMGTRPASLPKDPLSRTSFTHI